ncbi:MAG: hypothetical protein RL671_1469 [Pseudomonadota bacterium]
MVLLLDCNGKCLRALELSSGLRSRIRGRYRTIVSAALAAGAHKLLLAHNHPSHSPMPSAADFKLTRDLAQICAPLEISIIDHLIIAGRQITSMRKGNLL